MYTLIFLALCVWSSQLFLFYGLNVYFKLNTIAYPVLSRPRYCLIQYSIVTALQYIICVIYVPNITTKIHHTFCV